MLEEEERTAGIILRVYNKNPNVYIKKKLEDFTLKIVEELEKVQQNLYNLKNSEDISVFSQPIEEHENPGDVVHSRKKFFFECHQAQLKLTALLLSIEQLLNDENPNVRNFRRDDHLQAYTFMAYKTIND